MKKETIIAVTLGVLLGVVVAVGVIFSTRRQDGPKVIPVAQTTNVTPVAAKNNSANAKLEISQPQNSQITEAKTITIKGKATPQSLIIIQSPIRNLSIKNEKEDFSTDFPLALGENVINISVYAPESNGAVQERQLTIYSLDE